MVFRRHEEIARFGWVVRCLLRDIVAASAIGIIPIAGEDFTQDWVQRLLDAPVLILVGAHEMVVDGIRWFDVPTTQVELGHCYESCNRVLDFRHWQKCFWVSHEATRPSAWGCTGQFWLSKRTLLSFPAWIAVPI